jgi:hypothetical protein
LEVNNRIGGGGEEMKIRNGVGKGRKKEIFFLIFDGSQISSNVTKRKFYVPI